MIVKNIAGNAHDVDILRVSEFADAGDLLEITIEGVDGRHIVIHQVIWSLDDDPAAAVPLVLWNGDTDDNCQVDVTKGGTGTMPIHFVVDEGQPFYLNLMADNETVASKATVFYSSQAA